MRKLKIFSNLVTRLLCISALLCLAACGEWTIGEGTVSVPYEGAEILLTITSDQSTLTNVTIKVRTIDYRGRDTINKWLGDRNIISDPIRILIRPSSVIPEDTPFLLHSIGEINGTIVVSAADTFMYESNTRIERKLVMRQRIDEDEDGYASCSITTVGEPCDCNDQDPSINPFTIDYCTDSIDNNCNGVVNEACEDAV